MRSHSISLTISNESSCILSFIENPAVENFLFTRYRKSELYFAYTFSTKRELPYILDFENQFQFDISILIEIFLSRRLIVSLFTRVSLNSANGFLILAVTIAVNCHYHDVTSIAFSERRDFCIVTDTWIILFALYNPTRYATRLKAEW